MSGDAEEAEAVVKTAVRGGLQPNPSTYHLMASMWLREEQLGGGSGHPFRDPVREPVAYNGGG